MNDPMDFISNQEPQFQEMLAAVGVSSIDELFSEIPKGLRRPKPKQDDGLSEYEGMRHMEALASKNTYPQQENYLGAGSYEHHVPAIVGSICGKSEFLTAYTPYQAEASQGMLQIIFEFQSAICALTGMDVSNASLYDGASACAEAVLMAMRLHKERKKIIVAHSLNPLYRGVVDQYIRSHDVELIEAPCKEDGSIDMAQLDNLIDKDTAAVLVQYPNFFGLIDDIKSVSHRAKSVGALTIICANPMVYGLYHSAEELGADIAVGDCQPFGIPLQFGGPYAGYMACKADLVRQLPGRIVGETIDTQGRRGFVLTLQAREQHIRREKATSNICTNQALAALASLVTMLWYGKEGVMKVALTNYQRAAYLKSQLEAKGAFPISNEPFFNEFVIKVKKPMEAVLEHFRQHGIEPGLDLGRFFPELQQHLLIAVTETKTQEQLDRYVSVAKNYL